MLSTAKRCTSSADSHDYPTAIRLGASTSPSLKLASLPPVEPLNHDTGHERSIGASCSPAEPVMNLSAAGAPAAPLARAPAAVSSPPLPPLSDHSFSSSVVIPSASPPSSSSSSRSSSPTPSPSSRDPSPHHRSYTLDDMRLTFFDDELASQRYAVKHGQLFIEAPHRRTFMNHPHDVLLAKVGQGMTSAGMKWAELLKVEEGETEEDWARRVRKGARRIEQISLDPVEWRPTAAYLAYYELPDGSLVFYWGSTNPETALAFSDEVRAEVSDVFERLGIGTEAQRGDFRKRNVVHGEMRRYVEHASSLLRDVSMAQRARTGLTDETRAPLLHHQVTTTASLVGIYTLFHPTPEPGFGRETPLASPSL